METLAEIQQALRAPKGQINAFGKYKYRSCEDILTAVKPLLGEWALTVSDEIVLVGDRYYVKATATLGGQSVTAYARESLDKKGMDAAQITGSASSYARKYALNGLFAIDDTKDSDATNDHGKKAPSTLDRVRVAYAKADKEDSPALADFLTSKGITPAEIKDLDENGLKGLLKDLEETFK